MRWSRLSWSGATRRFIRLKKAQSRPHFAPWPMIEGEELVRLKRRVREVTGWKTNRLTARRARASFYASGYLLYLEGESGTGCAVEGHDGTLFPLDGSSAQIYDANEAAGLRLDIDNVVDYAIFFCGFLRAGDGDRFRIVVERGNWDWMAVRTGDLTPCVRKADDGSGSFEIAAYVAHCGALHHSLFRVENDGVVMMMDDEPLGEIVGLQ